MTSTLTELCFLILKKSMGLFAKILQKMSKCDKDSGETLSCTSSATFFS